MACDRIFNKSNTIGATIGVGIIYYYGAPDFVRVMLFIFQFEMRTPNSGRNLFLLVRCLFLVEFSFTLCNDHREFSTHGVCVFDIALHTV